MLSIYRANLPISAIKIPQAKARTLKIYANRQQIEVSVNALNIGILMFKLYRFTNQCDNYSTRAASNNIFVLNKPNCEICKMLIS